MAETRTFSFSSRPEAVTAARRALHGYEDWFDAEVFYDASLCVSELVTNAVLHGSAGPDDELVLEVAVADGMLSVAVVDAGAGFDPGDGLSGPDGDDVDHGWGLRIVDQLALRWGVERIAGTRVWFEMEIG